jgi:hypothetical protein
MHDDTRPMLEAARPLGSGAQAADTALFDQIDALIGTGQAADSIAAARILVAAGKVAGHGTDENKAQRLARRWREHRGIRIISQPACESGDVPAMSTAPTSAPTAPAPDVVAAMATRLAALEGTVAALSDAAAETDMMMARLVEDRAELVRELLETREASAEVRDALQRQTDTMAKLVGANELRHTARIRTMTEH